MKKCLHHLLYADTLLSLWKINVKKSENVMKIVIINRQNPVNIISSYLMLLYLHILWMKWGISMKSSRKISLVIILKATHIHKHTHTNTHTHTHTHSYTHIHTHPHTHTKKTWLYLLSRRYTFGITNRGRQIEPLAFSELS